MNFKMKFEQKTENSNPALYIYGDIFKTFEDWWDGKEGNTAKGIQQFLADNKDAQAIDVYLNSMGGDVFEGTAIANQLRRFDGDVNITIDGFACSIASVIAMAGTKVMMPRNATMMIHNMWTTMSGNAQELRKMADDLDVLMDANKTIYLDKSNGKVTEDKLTEMLDAETWLTADECVEYGFCDEILDYTVDEQDKAIQAGTKNFHQRTEDSIAQLKQSRQMLQELEEEFFQVVEPPAPEEDDDVKPRNFLELFS